MDALEVGIFISPLTLLDVTPFLRIFERTKNFVHVRLPRASPKSCTSSSH